MRKLLRKLCGGCNQVTGELPELKMSEAECQAFINDRQGAVGQKLGKLYVSPPASASPLRFRFYAMLEFIVRGVITGATRRRSISITII